MPPRQESNPQLSLRTGLLYPFNYGENIENIAIKKHPRKRKGV